MTQMTQKNFLADDDAKYEVNIAVLEAIDDVVSEKLGRPVKVRDKDLPELLPTLEALYDKMYLRSIGLNA